MALEGIRALHRSLPAVCAAPADLEARTGALYGAYLAATALATGGTGLHHRTCHVLGGMFGLDHGGMNAVVLGHALAYNAPAIPGVLTDLEAALGTDDAPGRSTIWPRTSGRPPASRRWGCPRTASTKPPAGWWPRRRRACGRPSPRGSGGCSTTRTTAGGRGGGHGRPAGSAGGHEGDPMTGHDSRGPASYRRFLQGAVALERASGGPTGPWSS